MDDPVNDYAFEEFFDLLERPPQPEAVRAKSLDVFPSEAPLAPDSPAWTDVAALPLTMSTASDQAPASLEAPPAVRAGTLLALVSRVPPSPPVPSSASLPLSTTSTMSPMSAGSLLPLTPPSVTVAPVDARAAQPIVPAPTAPSAHARDEELRAMVESADARIAAMKAQLRTMRRPSVWSRAPLRAIAAVAAVVIVGSTMWARRAAPGADTAAPAVAPEPARPEARDPQTPAALEPVGAASPATRPRRADASGVEQSRPMAATRQSERPRPAASAAERDVVGTGGSTVNPSPQSPSPAGRHTEAVILTQEPAHVPGGTAPTGALPTVEVDVTIDTEGHALKAIALAGDEAWRRAAEAAALQWRYQPATEEGVAVVSDLRVRVPFE